MHVCNFITTQIRDKYCKNYCNYSRHTESKKQSFKIVSRGGTSAKGTGSSIRTRRHSALLEVADHSRCRKMFAVQSRERPPGRRRRRRSRSRSARTSTRKKTTNSPMSSRGRRSPKNLIARNTRAGVSLQGVGFRRPALPISVHAEVRNGNGQKATRQERED